MLQAIATEPKSNIVTIDPIADRVANPRRKLTPCGIVRPTRAAVTLARSPSTRSTDFTA
jgi:hypothetical protein